MSNRVAGFVVTFEEGVTEEYMQRVEEAIGIYHGVLSVEPIVENLDIHIAEKRVRSELGQKLFDIVFPEKT